MSTGNVPPTQQARPVNTEPVWIPFEFLEAFVIDVFRGLGVPDEDARICADVIITADKRGIDSHGVGRLKLVYYDRLVKGIQRPITEFEIVSDRGATALVDGHNGMGMVVSKRAMEMAIEKARRYGVGTVVARNSTHYGFAAYYPLMAVQADMIGLTATNARPSVAPTHGVDNMLGTNPLVFAFPSDEPFPFTNDYATSIVQRGKIEQWAREGKKCPEGVVVDQEGRALTDPAEILEGLTRGTAALAPIGGLLEETGSHKGYGFATVVELLTSALALGPFLRQLSGKNEAGQDVPILLSHFFLAINVEHFADVDAFKKHVGHILRSLRASRKAPGRERIYTCGEKEYLAWLERKDKGVPVDPGLQKDLVTMRDELGLPYTFPFE